MNENKMMSYEMYEELKSSIVKTIKTEIANAKLTNTMPNNLSQQIEQAVLSGLAQYRTTLEWTITTTFEQQSAVLAEVRNLRKAVSEIEIPKELPPRWYNHRYILGSDSKTLTVFFVTCLVIIGFMSIALWDARQPNVQRDDNDLKYRYMKMKGDVSPELMAELEDIFTINRDAERIKQMRSDVEEYEQTILRQAALIEQARLKAQEAEQLDAQSKSIKGK